MILTGLFLVAALVHLIGEARLAFWFHQVPKVKDHHATPSISVVVCARNEGENLKMLIHQLLAQTYDRFEIILVLDRCSDDSEDLAHAIQDSRFSFITIREVPKEANPKKYGLTAGIRAAKNNWILLTDGDCTVPSRHWIESFVPLMTDDTDFVLGVGHYEKKPGLLSAFIQYETFQTAFQYTAACASGQPYMGVGRNLAYRKEVFLKHDGFANHLSTTGGDDDLFVQAHATGANTKINLHPDSFTFTKPTLTFSEYLKQKTRHLGVGRYYKKEFKRMLVGRSVVYFVLWGSFLILIGNPENRISFVIAFGFVWLIKGLLYRQINKSLQMDLRLTLFPLLDFSYAVLLPFVGIRSFFVKKYSWKK